VLDETVQPAIQASLPSIVKGQFHFHLERCHLGHEPLSLNAASVTTSSQSTFEGDAKNILLTTALVWEGDCSIFMNFAGAGVGIGSFSVKGELNIELVCLVDQPPMCKGVRAFFLSPPDVFFEWQGAAKVDYLGVLKRTVIKVVKAAISERLVLPNVMGQVMLADADEFLVAKPLPEGLLRLTVKSAEGLRAADRDLLGRLTTSDPYFELSCGAATARSVTQYKTLSPVYNHTEPILVASLTQQRVRIMFYDENDFRSSDFLGMLDLPITSAISWGEEVQRLPLMDESGQGRASGHVWLSAEWRPLSMDLKRAAKDKACFVFAGLYGASGVPVLGQGFEHWVAAACSRSPPLSPHPAAQESHRMPDTGVDQEEMDCQVRALKEKLACLESHEMRRDEIAWLLGVDPDVLERMHDRDLGLASSGTQDFRYDHAFHFLSSNYKEAVVTFTLMARDVARAQEPVVLGTHPFSVAELLGAERHALRKRLRTASGELELLLQLRFLAAPTDEDAWFDADD
jgi:hypothetical protein